MSVDTCMVAKRATVIDRLYTLRLPKPECEMGGLKPGMG